MHQTTFIKVNARERILEKELGDLQLTDFLKKILS